MDIGVKIKSVRKELGMTQEQLCKRAGIDRVTLSFIENSKRTPEFRTLEKIAKGMDVTPMELVSYGEEVNLNPDGLVEGRPIPLLGYVEAGRYAISYNDGAYPVGIGMGSTPRGGISDPNAYSVVVEGDSMLPTLRPGYVIVASPNTSVINNDLVICRIKENEEVFVKRIRLKRDTVVLESDNKAYDTMVLTRKEVIFYHKVVAIYPK